MSISTSPRPPVHARVSGVFCTPDTSEPVGNLGGVDVNTHEETATGRLFLLMNFVHELRTTPNMNLQQAFTTYYGLGTADLGDLLHLLAAAVALPDAAENEATGVRLPIAPGRFTWALDATRQALGYTAQLQGHVVGNITGLVTEGVVYVLESASQALWMHRGDPGASPQMLLAVQEAVLRLIDAVTNDPALDAEARRLLMKYATELNTALAYYRAFGFESLREWEERFLGAMALRPAVREAVEDRPGIMTRILGVFSAVNTVASAVQAVYVLGADVTSFAQLLPPTVGKS